MADSKLRLQIITALDAAGIKATQDQINGLSKSLSNANKQGDKTFMGLPDKLTKINGKMGELIGSMGKFGKCLGVVGLAVEAFKKGWDLGTWIAKDLLKIKDPYEELRRQNQRIAKEHEKGRQAMEARSEAAEEAFKREVDAINREVAAIDKMKNSLANAARMKHELHTIGMDADLQQLERERFEDVMALEQSGNIEGARQVEYIYDILRKQMEAKKTMAALDHEEAEALAEIKAEEEKSWSFTNKKFKAKKAMERARADLKALDDDENITSNGESTRRRLEKQYLRRLKNAEIAFEQAIQEETIAMNELEAKQDSTVLKFQMRRATLEDQANLEIDRSAYEYDKFINANGDQLGWGEWAEDYGKTLTEKSIASYEQLKLLNMNFDKFFSSLTF